jgi:phytoene synthase
MSDSGFRHCLSVLREHDPDRHVAVLWLPEKVRLLGAALYAVAAEVARAPMLAREPAAGEIRLQWWAEAVDGRRDQEGHPVVAELRAQLAAHSLPIQPLLELVEARRGDLYHDPMPGIAELEAYCGHTSSVLFQLLALVCGAERSKALADACGHAGVAITAAGLCRSAGKLRAMGHCHIPLEFLATEGLTAATYVAGDPGTRHLAALRRLAAFAEGHLAQARAALAELPDAPVAVFLPLCLVEPTLQLVQRSGLRIFSSAPEMSPVHRHWRFLRAALSGRP